MPLLYTNTPPFSGILYSKPFHTQRDQGLDSSTPYHTTRTRVWALTLCYTQTGSGSGLIPNTNRIGVQTHLRHKQDQGPDSSQTQTGSGSRLISDTNRIRVRTHPKHKQDQDSSQTGSGSRLISEQTGSGLIPNRIGVQTHLTQTGSGLIPKTQDWGPDSSQTQTGSGSGLIKKNRIGVRTHNTSRIGVRTHPKHKQDRDLG